MVSADVRTEGPALTWTAPAHAMTGGRVRRAMNVPAPIVTSDPTALWSASVNLPARKDVILGKVVCASLVGKVPPVLCRVRMRRMERTVKTCVRVKIMLRVITWMAHAHALLVSSWRSVFPFEIRTKSNIMLSDSCRLHRPPVRGAMYKGNIWKELQFSMRLRKWCSLLPRGREVHLQSRYRPSSIILHFSNNFVHIGESLRSNRLGTAYYFKIKGIFLNAVACLFLSLHIKKLLRSDSNFVCFTNSVCSKEGYFLSRSSL